MRLTACARAMRSQSPRRRDFWGGKSFLTAHERKKCLRSGTLILCVWLLSMLAGCGARQIDLGGAARHHGLEDSGYVGADGGIPLTETELKALNSTGRLDKGLSPAALRDVAEQFTFFLRKGRTTMQRFSQRSQTYLGYTREVFRQKGLPEELAFLAIVESGYNPRAVSPAGAAGAWQFMPYTGLKYGLGQDWWLDERLDPYEAAKAAADYLAKLHDDFHDWHLAVAAYNAGEGKIRRAMQGVGAKDFFTLKEKNALLDPKAQLKEETKQYVPRFLAVCKIMRNLEALGFDSVDMRRPPPVTRIEVRPGTDLMVMARTVGLSWGAFNEHNAAHKRYVTHAGRDTYVYVPTPQRKAALAFAGAPRSGDGWKIFVAGKNDSWQTLSQRTGIPVAALQSANRGVSLRSGGKIRLPAGPGFRMPAPEPEKIKTSRKNAKKIPTARNPNGNAAGANKRQAGNITHVVQPGETLNMLARKYDAGVAAIQELNGVENPEYVRAGQELRIPAAGAATVAPARERGSTGSIGRGSAPRSTSATYTVQAGDTLWAIARRHNLSPARLLALNKTDGKAPLLPGTKLLVSEQ